MRLHVLTAQNMRRLIDIANSKSVTKEDIIDIKKIDDCEYVLIYQSDEEPE